MRMCITTGQRGVSHTAAPRAAPGPAPVIKLRPIRALKRILIQLVLIRQEAQKYFVCAPTAYRCAEARGQTRPSVLPGVAGRRGAKEGRRRGGGGAGGTSRASTRRHARKQQPSCSAPRRTRARCSDSRCPCRRAVHACHVRQAASFRRASHRPAADSSTSCRAASARATSLRQGSSGRLKARRENPSGDRLSSLVRIPEMAAWQTPRAVRPMAEVCT